MKNIIFMNFLNKIYRKGRITKAVAGALSFVLVITSLDLTAFAYSGKETVSDKEIVEISSLSDEIANQTVKTDATSEDVIFPESLDVHVKYRIEKEIEVEVSPNAEIMPLEEIQSDDADASENISEEDTKKMEIPEEDNQTVNISEEDNQALSISEEDGQEFDIFEEITEEDNQEFDISEEIPAENEQETDIPKEDVRESDKIEQDASNNDLRDESTQQDDEQNVNTESRFDEDQLENVTGGEYDSEETVYVPMDFYEAYPSDNEILLSTLEELKDESEKENSVIPATETQKQIVIEEVEEYVSVSATWTIDEEKSSKKKFKDLEAGEKYVFVPTITEKGYAIAYDVEIPVITVTVEEDLVAFEQSVTADGVVITVTADEGVFPEGATVSAEKVTESEENEVNEAIDEVRDEEKNVAVSYTFDITVYDKDGNEIEPDTEKGSVKVTFKMAEISNENLEMDVYHVEETTDGLSVEDLTVDNVAGAIDEAVIETDGFSFYTVEFTYGTLQYVLEGDTRIELATVLSAVGLTENGNITSVVGSNDALFRPVLEDNIWYIEAVNAFSSEEWLKVTIDGIEYEIAVTDDQIVKTWSELRSALAGTNGTVTLGADITAGSSDSSLTVTGTKTLDLNGYVINANQKFRVIYVGSGATLNITDSNSTKEHYFSVDSNTKIWTLLSTKTSGCKTVKGGCITGGYIAGGSVSNGGGGILVDAGTINMHGGNIVGNSVITGSAEVKGGGVYIQSGNFNLYDGNIIGNTSKKGGSDDHPYGGGIYVFDGSFSMSGGSIAENYGGYGGGLTAHKMHTINKNAANNQKIEITGGKIENNTSVYSGGGVFICGDVNFTVSGGTVQNNTSHYIGGGICFADEKNGNATITGNTKIINNVAIHGVNVGNGGGVAMYGSNVTISGNVEITGNKSEDNGGGVALWEYSASTLKLGDSVKITGNYDTCDVSNDVVTGGKIGNLYVGNNITNNGISICSGSNAPKEGMNVGVTYKSGAGNVTNVSGTGQYAQYFSSDNAAYTIISKDGIIQLFAVSNYVASVTDGGNNTFMYISLEEAVNAVNNMVNTTESGTVIRLLKNYATTAPNMNISKSCTIDLDGHTLSNGYTNNGSLISTPLTQDGGITLKNGSISFNKDCSMINTESQYAKVLLTCDNLNVTGTGNAEGAYVNRSDDVLFKNCRISGIPILASGHGDGNPIGMVTYEDNCYIDFSKSLSAGKDWGKVTIVFKDCYLKKTQVQHYSDDSSTVDLRQFIANGYMWINTPNGENASSEDKAAYANGFVYKVVPSKTVSLNLNSGSVSSSYAGYRKNIGDDTVYEFVDSLELPTSTEITRNGYVFGGWYDNASFSGSKVTTVTENGKTYYAKWYKDATLHYSDGIYNGFTPYWQVATAPADVTLKYGSTVTLPASSSFSNVGYKLAGWTSVKPTDSSATKEYDTGDVLTAAQVNALYDKGTNGEVTLYAVWERDTTNVAWNADTNTYYTNVVTALENMKDNEELFIINNAQFNKSGGVGLAVNATVDGGKYCATVNESGVQRGALAGEVRTEDSRFTVTRCESGACGGHMLATPQGITETELHIKNIQFTTSNKSGSHKGFFCSYSNSTVNFENVKVTNFNGGSSDSGSAMFRGDDLSGGRITTYIFRDCQIEGNISQKALIVAGKHNNSYAPCYLEFYGNTTVTGNVNAGGNHNVEVYGPTYIKVGEDFTGEIGVYLTGTNTNMVAVTCDYDNDGVADDNEILKARALMGGTSGKVFSDQGYILSAVSNTVGVAKAATVTFNSNSATTGNFPATAKVNGVDTTIKNTGVLDAYYTAEVTIPGPGTLTKTDNLFMGWNTKPDGTGTNYTEGALYTVNSNNSTLYAIWKNVVASVNHNGSITYYDTLQKALDAAASDDKVTLLLDTKENISVDENKKFVLDLNGKVLKGTGSGSVVTIKQDAALTLDDSDNSSTHTGEFSSLPAGGVITGGGGVTHGGGVLIIGGTLNMNAGTIYGNTASDSGGGVCVGKSNYGDGLTAPSTFNMYGGTITGNTGTSWGGGVCVGSSSKSFSSFNMIGGLISNNTSADGAGVHVGGIGISNTFNMNGGTISGNTSSGSGGGVSVYLYNATTQYSFLITGGSIKENEANNNGAGVNIRQNSGTGIFSVGGTATITDNMKGADEQNVYLENGVEILLGTGSNAPKSGMSVGVTTATAPTVSTPVAITGNNGTDYSSYFTADNSEYEIKNVNNILKLMKAGIITNKTPESDKDTNNGYITINKSSALAGEEIIVTVIPNTGYTLKSLKYKTNTYYDIPNDNKFTMPNNDVEVIAEFEHNHNFTFSAEGKVLKATCIPGCPEYNTNPITLTLTEPASLVYDGNVKEITFASGEADKWSASDTGLGEVPAVSYVAKDGSELTDGKAVNVGDYTATVTMGNATASLDFSITKASSVMTEAPAANVLTYNGTDQALVSEGTATGGTLNYAIGVSTSETPESGWSETIPTGKKAQTFYVWYKCVGDNNHTDTEPVCVIVNIAVLEITVSDITAQNREYVPGDLSVTLDTSNAILTGKVDGDDLSVTAVGEMEDDSVQDNKSVLITHLELEGEDKSNYVLALSGHQTETTVTISEAASSVVTSPSPLSLTYSGSEQALVSEGVARDGIMKYAIGLNASETPESGWSETIPTGKNAGTYYVWYKCVGDSNHSDTEPVCVTITVAGKSITVSGITATNRGYIEGDLSVMLQTANANLAGIVDGEDLSITATGKMGNDTAGENKKVTIENLVLTGEDKDNYVLATNGQQRETIVTIAKVNHEVTAPKALNPIYDDTELVLISAGSCATGKIVYSLDEAGQYTSNVNDIKAKTPGIYTIYYKVLGDENYNEYTVKSIKSEIIDSYKPTPNPNPTPAPEPKPEKKPANTIPTVKTENPDNENNNETEQNSEDHKKDTDDASAGNVRVDAETSNDSPIQDAKVETKIDELTINSNIFTKQEIKKINNGADARVWINVDKQDMSLVSEKIQAKALELAEGLGSENAGLEFFDITLYKQLSDGDIVNIHEPGTELEITVKIPEELKNTNPNVKRNYTVLRIHDGKLDDLGCKIDEKGEYVVFKTNKFSTYALAYADTPIDEITEPDTDNTIANPIIGAPLCIIFSLLLLIIIGIITYCVIRRRKNKKE